MTSEQAVEAARRRAAEAAAQEVQSGQVVGYGTGRAAALVLEALAQRYREGTLTGIRGVPSSIRTAELAASLGLPLEPENSGIAIDITVDGADEVDPQLRLLKGGGGALLREKVLAEASARHLIVVDWRKQVDVIGTTRGLPIEAVPAVAAWVSRRLQALGAKVSLRAEEGRPRPSDNGLALLDAEWAGGISDPAGLAQALEGVPGLVEHGLFLKSKPEVFIGREDGGLDRLS